MRKYKNIIIFGGSGYIAGYILNYIAANTVAAKIYLADIKEPRREVWDSAVHNLFDAGLLEFAFCDVRKEIIMEPADIDLIFNLAAIHREPGHEPAEYFETNIKGAENVTHFAESKNCQSIVFTSSIAPYGHAHEPLDESSPVVPYSPYGSSKLVAEKIHEGWKNKNHNRKLIIVRPGVIYGPYEDGNVPRLKQALKKHCFCYVGNRDVQKAGGYVKELARSMFWTLDLLNKSNKKFVLYNFSFKNPPTLEEYVIAVTNVLGVKRTVLNLPYPAILALSHVISAFSKLINVNQPIHPKRIKKLKINNLIIPSFLIEHGYDYIYDLESSFADWKKDVPSEW